MKRRLLMELGEADDVPHMSAEWGVLGNATQMFVGHERSLGPDEQYELAQHLESRGCSIMGFMEQEIILVVGHATDLIHAMDHEHIQWAMPLKKEHKIAPEWGEMLEALGELSPNTKWSSVFENLPLQTMSRLNQTIGNTTSFPLAGIRVVFPAMHRPRRHDIGHPRHGQQNDRIEMWDEVHGVMHAGMAAAKDWSSGLKQKFGHMVEIKPAGPTSLVVYVEPWQVNEAISWLAERNSVQWIEPVYKFKMKNRKASTITQAGISPPSGGDINTDPKYHPLWAAGITGKDMVVGIGDSGLDYNHCFFADPEVEWSANIEIVGRVSTFTSTTHRKIRLYRAFSDFRDDNGHGTHTAGTLAGIPYGNTLSETSNINIGMAPDAKLAFIGV